MSEAAKREEIDLPGDRGNQTVPDISLEDYFAFGREIRHYQETHPDTIVRVTHQLIRGTLRGPLTVRWWPRGEKPEL